MLLIDKSKEYISLPLYFVYGEKLPKRKKNNSDL